MCKLKPFIHYNIALKSLVITCLKSSYQKPDIYLIHHSLSVVYKTRLY